MTGTQTQSRGRNMFGAADLREQLADVRRDVERAVLIAANLVKNPPGESVPDLLALRRREAELIQRIHVATFG